MIGEVSRLIIGLLILLSISVVMLYKVRKLIYCCRVSSKQGCGIYAIILYLLIVLMFTVFLREYSERQYQLEILWSWKEIIGIKENTKVHVASKEGLLQENLLNILMLFPVGLLLPIVVDGKAKKMAGLIVGTVFSVVIEILQLIFCRGLFEWDDIIHNSLGCMIGCLLYTSRCV